MSKLLVKPKAKSGLMQNVTPESAGWTYVGFALNRLKPGETTRRRGGRQGNLPRAGFAARRRFPSTARISASSASA